MEGEGNFFAASGAMRDIWRDGMGEIGKRCANKRGEAADQNGAACVTHTSSLSDC